MFLHTSLTQHVRICHLLQYVFNPHAANILNTFLVQIGENFFIFEIQFDKISTAAGGLKHFVAFEIGNAEFSGKVYDRSEGLAEHVDVEFGEFFCDEGLESFDILVVVDDESVDGAEFA